MTASKPEMVKSLPSSKLFLSLNSLLICTLWLITIALGILDVAAIRDGIFIIYTKFTASNQTIPHNYNALMTWLYGLTFMLSVALTVFSIDSAKLHLKHYGRPKSWRFFAWTIGGELFILALNLVLHLVIGNW